SGSLSSQIKHSPGNPGRFILLIKRLQQWVPDALPVVRKTSWHCRQCHHDYYGEQYCTHCHTGRFSEEAVAG
ncbi:putative zinc ribbon protein, partial [Escherichia coli]|uniref:putative zinc ribbon protein n=1 Tax=Escherichia coli TaxID=562 RepID=UPI0023622750